MQEHHTSGASNPFPFPFFLFFVFPFLGFRGQIIPRCSNSIQKANLITFEKQITNSVVFSSLSTKDLLLVKLQIQVSSHSSNCKNCWLPVNTTFTAFKYCHYLVSTALQGSAPINQTKHLKYFNHIICP